jgi:flagellar protein FliO/FliZ
VSAIEVKSVATSPAADSGAPALPKAKMSRDVLLAVIRGMAVRGLAITASIMALCLVAPAVFAAEKFAAPKASETTTAVGADGLGQVTLSLLLVLAAVFAAAWVVRRLRSFGKFGNGALQVITEVVVGTKERVVLIQVGNQQLLIGVAPGRVSTLHVLTEPVTPPTHTGTGVSADGSVPPSHDFKAILKRSLGL